MVDGVHIKRKLVLVGAPAVGKTSLIRKYVLDEFSDDYICTIGTKITRKELHFKNRKNGSPIELIMLIWDVMGQNDRQLNPISAFNGSKGAILVCDLTRSETYDDLSVLSDELLQLIPDLPLLFVGNKNDLGDRAQITESDVKKISHSYKAPYFITSAKTGENVENIFLELGKSMLKQYGISI